MSEEALVYVKCNTKKALEGGHKFHIILGKEWLFNPYCAMTLADFRAASKFFAYGGEFEVVEESEYLAWKSEIDAREAVIHYCGDFGGVTKEGEFCGRRVKEDGCRCEHHNESELQGSYERVDTPRPSGLR